MKKIFYQLILILFFSMGGKNISAQSPRPNFLIICTDDMSKKSVSLFDSLSLLPTPNINRIGEEGLNVKNYYSTNSLCIPGRATLLTGKYGHETGVFNNNSYLNNSEETFPKDLHNNGYYTALCGKWMVSTSAPKPEFDYWLWTPNRSVYFNDTCKYFDSTFIAYGHITDMLTDSVLSLISRVDTPFMIMLNHNAPHAPYFSQTQFDGMFTSVNFPIPQNFPAYYKNYPSPVYLDTTFYLNNYLDYENQMRHYYSMIAGIEESTGKILDSLEQLGLLDNTMVIFTTDNGFMIGPHQLKGKEYPYEEAIEMPLLIRYPPWFGPNSIIDSSFVINTDITPTILEAAGISPINEMEGKSIHTIFNHQFYRNEFMYEVIPSSDNVSIPQVRAIRTNEFQYTRYYCIDTTEELFDMKVDPLQKNNLVHNCAYQDTLILYRIKLDSIRLELNDTLLIADTCNCHLMNPVFSCCIPYSVNVSATICSGDSYLFSDSLLHFAGNYIDTLTDYFGCDSTVFLELNVLPTFSTSIMDTICQWETYNFNGNTLNSSGNYIAHLISSNTCDSVVNLHLTKIFLQATLSSTGDSLITNGNGFIKWINCNTDSIIPGETNNFYIPAHTGNYAAIISNGDCVDTTICKHVVLSGISDLEISTQVFSIFPNPASDFTTIQFSQFPVNCQIEISNLIGQTVYSFVQSEKSKRVSLQLFPDGIYFINLHSNNLNEAVKFMKY